MDWINVLFILTILFLLLFIYSFIERFWIKTTKYKVYINKKNFDQFKIIFISDFHHSSIVSKRFIKRIVRRVNDLKPDLIILGGDYISASFKYIEPLFKELNQMNAKYGIYGVIGNHDIDVSKEKILNAMKVNDIKSLDNKSYWIVKDNERIKIGGVADYLYDKPDIKNTLHDVDTDDFIILVSHNPDYVEEIKNHNINLMLSGHTHGGQVTIFGMYAPYIPSNYKQKYRKGLKQINQIKLIITNGIGVVGLPIRFFARPEIVEISLDIRQK